VAIRHKYKVNDKVIYNTWPATVLEVHSRKLVIRDAHGFRVPVRRKDVRPA
jgi:hypothetical protein